MSDRVLILGWTLFGVLVMAMMLRMFFGSDDEPPSLW